MALIHQCDRCRKTWTQSENKIIHRGFLILQEYNPPVEEQFPGLDLCGDCVNEFVEVIENFMKEV